MIVFLWDLITAVFAGVGRSETTPYTMDEDMHMDEEPIKFPNTVEEMQEWLREQADYLSDDGYYEEAEIMQHIAVQIGLLGGQSNPE